MNQACIFIVDDEAQILKAIERLFFQFPIEIKTFTSPREALENLSLFNPQVVISDLRMPFMTGLEFLSQVKEKHPDCHRILLSAHQDFEQVIHGFNDDIIHQFLSKPWKNDELIALVQQNLCNLDKEIGEESNITSIIGESAGMLQLKAQIVQVAGANVPIFINGKTGTGKELVAKACHELSYRKLQPFIAFNCANLNEHLLESQLFGHKKGAFTGADQDFEGLLTQAGEGTLFLDEVTTLPLNIQAKLLRVIQEREYTPLGDNKVLKLNAQILSASSTALEQATTTGEFRPDLYYRLAVIKLNIPPLNQRAKDQIVLAQYFLNKFVKMHNKVAMKLTAGAEQFILSYAWPGNVRQLENVIHHVVIMNNEKDIRQEHIQSAIGNEPLAATTATEKSQHQNQKVLQNTVQAEINGTLEDIEKHAILTAIDACSGNVSQAAVKLGVNPSTIYRKLQKWGIS